MGNDLFNNTNTFGFSFPIEERDTIDYLKDVRTQLRETMLKNYEPSKLDRQTEFSAICLRQLEQLTVAGETGKSFARIKARIPELHSMIPIPKSAEDYLTISLYPTFIGAASAHNPKLNAGSVLPGTQMVVTFQNMNNFAGPSIKSVSEILDTDDPEGTDKLGQRALAKRPKVPPVFKKIPNPFKQGKQFKNQRKRSMGIDQVLIHETGGRAGGIGKGLTALFNLINGKGGGVHFLIGRDGGITQHCPIDRQVSHAFQPHNDRSVGIELDNAMYGIYAKQQKWPSEAIPLKWTPKYKKRGGYLTPTSKQLASLYKVVTWVHKKSPTVPLTVPGQQKGKFFFSSSPGPKARPQNQFYNLQGMIPHLWGIQAGIINEKTGRPHQGHGDGLFPELYLYLRFNLKLGHKAAYERAKKVFKILGTGKKPYWWSTDPEGLKPRT